MEKKKESDGEELGAEQRLERLLEATEKPDTVLLTLTTPASLLALGRASQLIREVLAGRADHDTKEIDSCARCPMRADMRPHPDVCAHWGSPEGNQLLNWFEPLPTWCPIKKKPLLLKVVR